MAEQRKTLVVTRFDPDTDEAPTTREYDIAVEPDWKVLDALNHIKEHVDPTLSHRWSCRMAVCGSCGMNVNGEPRLTCKQPLAAYGERVEVAPLANFPVVRDLVVEMEGFLEKLTRVKPWIIEAKEAAARKAEPRSGAQAEVTRQSHAELMDFKQFSMCIGCMLCYSACPVVANEPEFLGPAAIALGHRYNQDTRDAGARERNAVLREDGGVFSCSYANECAEVCPKGVDPSGAIQQAKLNNVLDWAKNFVVPRGGAAKDAR